MKKKALTSGHYLIVQADFYTELAAAQKQGAVAESARNVSCVGAEPIAITNNLNFSSPETDIGYWQLSSSCNVSYSPKLWPSSLQLSAHNLQDQ